MYVLILVAAFYVADTEPPLAMITRPSVEHYPSVESCRADAEKKIIAFTQNMPKSAIGFAAKCVEVTGPAGQPA